MTQSTIYFVGGNIGAGKSTLVSSLNQTILPSSIAICEQPQLFSDDLNEFYRLLNMKMLDAYYNIAIDDDEEFPYNKKRTVLGEKLFTVQKTIIKSWWSSIASVKELLTRPDPPMHIVIERSPLESIDIFIRGNGWLLSKDRFLDLCRDYANLYAQFTQLAKCRHFNLDVMPSVCFGRIRQRSSDWDREVSLDYLRLLNVYYLKFFTKYLYNGPESDLSHNYWGNLVGSYSFCVLKRGNYTKEQVLQKFLDWVKQNEN